jgi:hypothetical protein
VHSQLTILLSVIPLLKQCSVTLALRVPAHLQSDIDKAVLKALALFDFVAPQCCTAGNLTNLPHLDYAT